jgi:hypothetical protein
MYIHNWYHSNVASILLYTRTQVTIYMAHSPCFFSPLADFPFVSPCSPFNPLLLTWNPPSCDRIRPPRSQVACNDLPCPNPFPKPSPLQIPRTLFTQRLTRTTSGTIWCLLSGTVVMTNNGNLLHCHSRRHTACLQYFQRDLHINERKTF